MFDHVKFGVSDYAASKAFFLKALEPLGVAVVPEGPPTYGVELSPKGKASLCLYQTEEKPRIFTWRSRPRIASKSKLSIARLWRRVAKTMVRLRCLPPHPAVAYFFLVRLPYGYRYSYVMRPLRYSINVTLDGCCDHRAIPADEELHRHAVENLDQADALLFGRVTYEMMEAAFRPPARTGARPDWMEPFARTIDAAKKYVVSSTLDRVDWNAELVRGDLGKAVQQLKRESGKGLFVGGVKLPLALAELGLIDEYEFVVQPRLAGHGPTLFAGLSKRVDLKLVSRLEFGSGAVAMRYEPRR